MPQLTWLITGCSSGFGEVFVRSILARGDKAIATVRGSVSRIDALVGAGARAYSLDVTASQTSINATFAQILEENGTIDVLVNNAGYIEGGIAEELRYVQIDALKCSHLLAR
jgi:NAD(P)-dependent dehydrogenase (short-subunit alcohol dehydrogenase family)